MPSGRIIHGLRNRKWSIYGAIAELVDNSFGELRGNADTVWIQWDGKKRILRVLDNGRGMIDVADLFILGEGTTSGPDDIGKYGMGGCQALLWLADDAIVQTLRADAGVACGRANWKSCDERNDFPTIDNQWRRATTTTCPTDLLKLGHGTSIFLYLKEGLRFHQDTMCKELSRRYSVALRTGRKIYWISGLTDENTTVIPLEPWNPGEMKDVVTGTITMEEELSAKVLAGRIDGLSVINSKLAVNYGYRQIKETTEGFGQIVQGAMGYIDLSPKWLHYLTTEKDDIREEYRHLEIEL